MINTLTNAVVTTVGVGDSAKAVAVNTVTNKVYVANFDSNSTSVIDGGCNCVTGALPFSWGPNAVAVDETTNLVYVGTTDGGHMTTYDGSTNAPVCTANPSTNVIISLAVNTINHRVYALAANGHGAVIDGSNCGILFDNVPTCSGSAAQQAVQTVYNPTDNRFYTPEFGTPNVNVFDGDTGAVVNCISLPGATGGEGGIGIDVTHQLVYATAGNGPTQRLYRIDLGSLAATTFIDPGISLWGVGVDPQSSRNYIYVAAHENAEVWVAFDDTSLPPPPPTVANASSGGTTTSIQGTLAAAPATTYVVSLYSNTACSPSGAVLLGSVSATTDAAGNANFVQLLNAFVPAGQFIMATATSTGAPSAFSACATVVTRACADDSDCDGYADAQEIALGTNPFSYCQMMRADVNGDGMVNILDLSIVAGVYAQTVPPAPARYDQNFDGVINILDLSKTASVYQKPVTQCP